MVGRWSAIGVLVLIAVGSSYLLLAGKHQSIPIDQVQHVRLWQERVGEKELVGTDRDQLLEAFNNATYDRANDEFFGTTPQCGGVIELKNGKSIGIIGCGEGFQVQRNDTAASGRLIAYYVDAVGFRSLFQQLLTETDH